MLKIWLILKIVESRPWEVVGIKVPPKDPFAEGGRDALLWKVLTEARWKSVMGRLRWNSWSSRIDNLKESIIIVSHLGKVSDGNLADRGVWSLRDIMSETYLNICWYNCKYKLSKVNQPQRRLPPSSGLVVPLARLLFLAFRAPRPRILQSFSALSPRDRRIWTWNRNLHPQTGSPRIWGWCCRRWSWRPWRLLRPRKGSRGTVRASDAEMWDNSFKTAPFCSDFAENLTWYLAGNSNCVQHSRSMYCHILGRVERGKTNRQMRT